MKYRYAAKALVAIIVIILLWVSAISIDYSRATQRHNPLFTFRTEFWCDGGTKTFRGIGYSITFYNQTMTNGRMDTVFQFGGNTLGFERTFPAVTN